MAREPELAGLSLALSVASLVQEEKIRQIGEEFAEKADKRLRLKNDSPRRRSGEGGGVYWK